MQTQNEYTSVSNSKHGASTTASGSHTPGPWHYEQNGIVGSGKHGPEWVCSVTQWIAETEANAKLIAAAPEMVEVLRYILEEAEAGLHTIDSEGMGSIRAVLRKLDIRTEP